MKDFQRLKNRYPLAPVRIYRSAVKLLPFSKKAISYYILAALFFFISFFSISIINKYATTRHFHFNFSFLSPSIIITLAILLIAYFLVDGLRLYYVVKAIDCHIAIKEIMKLVFINIFVSNITPLATGGGLAQVYFMTKKDMPMGKAMAASTIRTFLAMMFLFVSAPFVVLYQRNLYDFMVSTHTISIITLIVICYIFLFYVIIFKPRLIKIIVLDVVAVLRRLHFLSARRQRKWLKRAIREVNNFSGSFTLFLSGHPRYILLSIFFTVLFLLLLFSFSVVLVEAMGYHISILTILAMQAFVTFLMYFAPTPGASGVAEGGYALIFSRLIQPADIATLTLLWRFFTIYIGMITGIVIMYLELSYKKESSHAAK